MVERDKLIRGVINMSELFTIDCGEFYLREFTIDDVDAIYEITSQPEVYEFLPDWKSTREQRYHWVKNYEIPSNKKFLAEVPDVTYPNYFKLGMILKETGKFIGFCNTGTKEELPAPNQEIVYAISKEYRNRGYVTKAVRELINYLFTNTNIEVLNAVALLENGGSNKVIQKTGFQFTGEMDIDKQKHNHYILVKEDWSRNK